MWNPLSVLFRYGQQLPLGLGILAPISAWYAMPIAAALSGIVSDLHLLSFVKIEAYRKLLRPTTFREMKDGEYFL